jgi:hypothetical protein
MILLEVTGILVLETVLVSYILLLILMKPLGGTDILKFATFSYFIYKRE